MNTKTLKNLLAESQSRVLLVDVREPDEVSDEPYFDHPPKNYIPLSLTVISVMPERELEEKIMETLAHLEWKKSDVQIVTLCYSGRRSEMACIYFSRIGFLVESLDGGYGSWIKVEG